MNTHLKAIGQGRIVTLMMTTGATLLKSMPYPDVNGARLRHVAGDKGEPLTLQPR